MDEIWYGIADQVQTSSSYFAEGGLAWLAVPPGDGVEGGQNQQCQTPVFLMDIGD